MNPTPMISLVLKNWRFILDALLIVALVALVFLLNPFGIFGNGLSLGTTTNMVTEVRQIGQLVTAEYYGEVISSIDESRLALVEENNSQQEANQWYSDIKFALFDLYQYQQLSKEERTREYKASGEDIDNWRRIVRQDVSRRNIVEKLEFHKLLEERNDTFTQVIGFLWREKLNHQDERERDEDHQLEEVLFNMYSELAERHARSSTEGFAGYLNDGFEFSANYTGFILDNEVAALPRAERKKKLAMVGRGWVKAGFDFSELDEHTFYFHEESGELHFFGLEPQILNADINPWFIPERGIPGFEIIDYRGEVNFKDARKVKQHCIDKLALYALQADIIGQARRQGAETLKSFFSLITGKEVTQVHFHNDILTQTANIISQDEYVSYYEGILVDSLLQREQRAIDSLRSARTNRTKNQSLAAERDNLRKVVIKQLRQLPFEDEAAGELFNYYSTLTYRIALDSIVDQHEQKLLQQSRWDITQEEDTANIKRLSAYYKSPKCWFEDTLALTMQYNAALDYLRQLPVTVADTFQRTLPNNAIEDWLKNTPARVLNYQTVQDTTRITYLDTLTIRTDSLLTALRYPYAYHPDTFTQYVRADSLLSTTVNYPPDYQRLSGEDSSVLVVDPMAATAAILWIHPRHYIDSLLISRLNDSIITDSLTFILLPYMAYTNGAERWNLTPQQQQELFVYYCQLKGAFMEYEQKGAIVKASEWVRRQFSHSKDSVSTAKSLGAFFFN
uniref:Uncharacterized protein n=1 Tax=Roseihalotalea indica TaxID=2867963 RepID=A0AA49GN35_9BACT|nr:hypothetical protein K4G66_29250 [Tunicatimonas sp. TK19036]